MSAGPFFDYIGHLVHEAVSLGVEPFTKRVVGKVQADALSQAHLGPRPSEFCLSHVSSFQPIPRSSLGVQQANRITNHFAMALEGGRVLIA